jgi:hypothetical protein
MNQSGLNGFLHRALDEGLDLVRQEAGGLTCARAFRVLKVGEEGFGLIRCQGGYFDMLRLVHKPDESVTLFRLKER